MTMDSRLAKLDKNALIKNLNDIQTGLTEIKNRQFIGGGQFLTYKTVASKYVKYHWNGDFTQQIIDSITEIDSASTWNWHVVTPSSTPPDFKQQGIELRFFPDTQEFPLVFPQADHFIDTPTKPWSWADWVSRKIFAFTNDYWDAAFFSVFPDQDLPSIYFNEIQTVGYFDRGFTVQSSGPGGTDNYLQVYVISSDTGRLEIWDGS